MIRPELKLNCYGEVASEPYQNACLGTPPPPPHPSRRSVCASLKFPDCVVKVAFPACRHFGYSTLHINIAHFFPVCRLTTLEGTICFDAYFTYARGWVVWFVTAS